MRRGLVFGAILLAIVGVALPVSFIATILLVPFWRWLEADRGIEAIGHSGPAEWCFWLMWALCVATALVFWRVMAARRGREEP